MKKCFKCGALCDYKYDLCYDCYKAYENGEWYETENGYIKVYRPEHPKAGEDGYVYEHTLKAQQKYKRELEAGEVVHHRDGNKKNNHWSNLEIMTRSEHWHEHND